VGQSLIFPLLRHFLLFVSLPFFIFVFSNTNLLLVVEELTGGGGRMMDAACQLAGMTRMVSQLVLYVVSENCLHNRFWTKSSRLLILSYSTISRVSPYRRGLASSTSPIFFWKGCTTYLGRHFLILSLSKHCADNQHTNQFGNRMRMFCEIFLALLFCNFHD
jgi:hypothetical protein